MSPELKERTPLRTTLNMSEAEIEKLKLIPLSQEEFRKCDIWSIGATFYQMLTGNLYFQVSNFKIIVVFWWKMVIRKDILLLEHGASTLLGIWYRYCFCSISLSNQVFIILKCCAICMFLNTNIAIVHNMRVIQEKLFERWEREVAGWYVHTLVAWEDLLRLL